MTTITVSGKETLEEVYFLLRTAMWHQEHFAEWIDHGEHTSYETGYEDGITYARDGFSQDDKWEEEYNRGYETGFDEGMAQGINEGYKDGYADGSREFG